MVTAAQIHATLEPRFGRQVNKIALYGDSGTGGLMDALEAALPNEHIIARGVGGYSIENIADAYTGEGLWRGYLLVVFDLSGDSQANTEAHYPRIVTAHTRSDNKILLVSPTVTGDLGTGITHQIIGAPLRETQYIGPRDWIANTYPDYFVPIYQALLDGNDGSAGDLDDVANGIVPRSLRQPGDSVHLNPDGSTIVAAQVVAKMTSNGWFA